MSKPLNYQIVARARELISDPRRWTQETYALFKNGHLAEPEDARAHRFCAVGALMRASHELASDPIQSRQLAAKTGEELERFANLPKRRCLEDLNDRRTNGHATVLNLFDRYLATH
jgi:hypothetical protein